LLNLTDTVATFKKGGRIENVEFRYSQLQGHDTKFYQRSAINSNTITNPNTAQGVTYRQSPTGYENQIMPAPPLKKLN
jgi:hypothetical protein